MSERADDDDEVEQMESGGQLVRRESVQVHDDADVHEAARRGYISGPCDCFLSIWAVLGEATEGGADQIVGLVLLPLTGVVYYIISTYLASPGSGIGGIGGIGQGLGLGSTSGDAGAPAVTTAVVEFYCGIQPRTRAALRVPNV